MLIDKAPFGVYRRIRFRISSNNDVGFYDVICTNRCGDFTVLFCNFLQIIKMRVLFKSGDSTTFFDEKLPRAKMCNVPETHLNK